MIFINYSLLPPDYVQTKVSMTSQFTHADNIIQKTEAVCNRNASKREDSQSTFSNNLAVLRAASPMRDGVWVSGACPAFGNSSVTQFLPSEGFGAVNYGL